MTTAVYVITECYGHDGSDTTTVSCTPAQLELLRKNFTSYGNITILPLDEWINNQLMDSSKFSQLTTPPQQRGIWWLAVDLLSLQQVTFGVQQQILAYALEYLTAVKHYHVTLAYNVTKEDKPEVLPRIKVRGLAYNKDCACLVIDFIGNTSCCNKHPHITLALAEGVPPVYSNEMLAGKDGSYHFLPLEAELEGTLEFFEFKDQV